MDDVAVLVCSFTGHFPDDVRTDCADCGASIVHRPDHAGPQGIRKICIRCARSMFADVDPRTLHIPEPEPKQAEELRAFGFTPEAAHSIAKEFAADPLSERWKL